MKNIFYIIIFLLLLTSCKQPNYPLYTFITTLEVTYIDGTTEHVNINTTREYYNSNNVQCILKNNCVYLKHPNYLGKTQVNICDVRKVFVISVKSYPLNKL